MIDSLPLSDVLARSLNLEARGSRSCAPSPSGARASGATVSIPELHLRSSWPPAEPWRSPERVSAKEPVRRLGQLLQAMLTDAEVPVQLRLIVSQATAPMPSYASLADFDRALGLRAPGRAAVLDALFARAQAAGPVTAVDAAMTLDRIAPLPEAKPAGEPVEARRKHSRRLIGTAAAVIAALALSGAAALYARSDATTVRGRQVSRVTAAAADVVGDAVLVGISAVSNSVGLGRVVAADAADAPPAALAVLPSASRRRTQPSQPAAASSEPVEPNVEENLSPRTIIGYDPPDLPDAVSEAIARHAEIVYLSAEAPNDLEVYAPGADGVSPPVGLYPQLPRQVPPTVDPAKLSRIELLIARDGTVESARLLGNRRDVQAGMLLSAAKTWEFQPAMKDGVAVRYRKTILVSFE